MADWNLLIERTKNLTLAGLGKAKELGEIARLNLNSISEEEKIKQLYVQIGMEYVKQHEGAPEAGYADFFAKMEQAKANIRANKEAIAKIKNEGNISEEEIEKIQIPLQFDQDETEL